ncbi:MAG: type I methionyl aminopeptidase [Candidatus Margulisiibacteriota bacterium]
MSMTEKIDSMRIAGRILSNTFDHISCEIQEGITALVVDQLVKDFIESNGASPGFLGYQGYKYSSCISKNEEIVHGIPYADKVFFDGDIVSIDIGVKYNGYYADAARTFLIGNVSEEARFLAQVTQDSFFKGMEGIKAGSRLGDISHAIQSHIESNGLTVVRDLYSHGVGQSLHEEPLIPNYGKKGAGMKLYEGMTMAIEPMVNLGVPGIETLDDDWTIVTKDRKWSAHYENTILITSKGVEILTITG